MITLLRLLAGFFGGGCISMGFYKRSPLLVLVGLELIILGFELCFLGGA